VLARSQSHFFTASEREVYDAPSRSKENTYETI